ncbi:MAG: hypothetical protein ACTHJ8_09765 [Mucilaginibacter sp.]|jgi:hypothetical protein
MYLAYSALRQQDESAPNKSETEIQLRYQAYLEACHKHRQFIDDIRKYFPNWTPKFH